MIRPIMLALRAGESEFKAPGAVWMPELQAMHAIRCLKRSAYDDRPRARLRRHVLIMGPPGSSKSSLMNTFIEDICGAVDYNKIDDEVNDKPTYYKVDGGGVTWEKLRGGSAEGFLIFPSLHEVDYLLSPELFAFLKGGKSMNDKMEVLNSALEEGDVVISQLAMSAISDKRKQAFYEQCDGTPVHYNATRGSITYKVNASMVAASRFFVNNQEEQLESSGFLSRFYLSIWRPSEEEDNDYQLNKHGEPDMASIEELQRFNLVMWNTRFNRVNYPPPVMVKRVLQHYFKEYRRISSATDMPISELRGNRDENDAAQLLTAFAAMRQVQEAIDRGHTKPVIDKIEYTEADVRGVMAFRDYYLCLVEEKAMMKATDDPVRDRALNQLVSFLKKYRGDDPRDAPDVIDTGELAKYIMDITGIRRSTAYNHIGKLVASGFLQRVRKGYATVSDSALVYAGFPSAIGEDEARAISADEAKSLSDDFF